MSFDLRLERVAFQAAVAVGACVPVFGGLAGVLFGACAFDADGCRQLDPFLQSHTRYLSGLLLAIGLAFWTTLPAPETRTGTYRLLTAIVVAAGLARLYGVLVGDPAHAAVLWTLAMELVVTPALWLWQARIARLSRRDGC